MALKKLYYYCAVFLLLGILFLSSFVREKALLRNSVIREKARAIFGQQKFYKQMHSLAIEKGLIP